MHRIHLLFLPALACATIAGAAVPGDPPSRVARLSYLRGPVSYSPAGVDAWARASLNRPVVTGDRVWTEPGARDELQVGNAAIRMDGATLLNVLNLDDQVMQMQLTQGTLDIRVRSLPASGAIEVDTPNLAFSIMRPGHYRIDVDPSGAATTVRVADGQAQAIGRDRAYLVNPGQAFRFGGTDLAPVQLADATGRDGFDRWSSERDQRARHSRSARYVSPAMIGYEDLDENGSWRDVDGYGPVWMPAHVSRNWAPYRDGHWAWVEPWGWTWVDDAPWGFATTHYGRWANVRGDWGWVPGPAAAAPVYAPALVMFVAAGNLIDSHRRPDQGVAWFPLAPREVYRPSYRASQNYVTNINISNTIVNQTQINNIYNGPVPGAGHGYQNRQVPGAVTAVPARVFAHAQPVRAAAVALPGAMLAAAALMPAATVRAQRDSLASGLASGHRPAPAALARPVMTRMAPPRIAGGRPPVAQAVPAPTLAPPEPRGHGRHERDGAQPGWQGRDGAQQGWRGRDGAPPGWPGRGAPGRELPAGRELPPGQVAGPAALPAHGVPPAAIAAGAVVAAGAAMHHRGRALPPGPAPVSALPPGAAHNPGQTGTQGRPDGGQRAASMPPNVPPHLPPAAAGAPPVPMPMPAAAPHRHGRDHGMPPAPAPALPAPMAAPPVHGHERGMPPTLTPPAPAPAPVPVPMTGPHMHGPAHAMPPTPMPAPAPATPMAARHDHGAAHAVPPMPAAASAMSTAARHDHGPAHAMPPMPAAPMPTAAPYGHGPAHRAPPAEVAPQRPQLAESHRMQERPMAPAPHASPAPAAPPHPPARPIHAEPPPSPPVPHPVVQHAVVQHPPVAHTPAPPPPQPAKAPPAHTEPPHPPTAPGNAHPEGPPQHPPHAPGKPDHKEAHHEKD